MPVTWTVLVDAAAWPLAWRRLPSPARSRFGRAANRQRRWGGVRSGVSWPGRGRGRVMSRPSGMCGAGRRSLPVSLCLCYKHSAMAGSDPVLGRVAEAGPIDTAVQLSARQRSPTLRAALRLRYKHSAMARSDPGLSRVAGAGSVDTAAWSAAWCRSASPARPCFGPGANYRRQCDGSRAASAQRAAHRQRRRGVYRARSPWPERRRQWRRLLLWRLSLSTRLRGPPLQESAPYRHVPRVVHGRVTSSPHTGPSRLDRCRCRSPWRAFLPMPDVPPAERIPAAPSVLLAGVDWRCPPHPARKLC